MHAWPFDQAPDEVAVTTSSILDGADVLLVLRYSDDGSWAFLDGRPFEVAEGRLIGIGEALRVDPTLATIADLGPGWRATRAHRGAAWERTPDVEDE